MSEEIKSKEVYVAKAVLMALAGTEFRTGDITGTGISLKTKQRALNNLVEAGILRREKGEKIYRPGEKLFDLLTAYIRTEEEWYSFLVKLVNATFKPATRNPLISAMKKVLRDMGETP